MSDLREIGLEPLAEREAAEIEGGQRALGPIIIICEPPPIPPLRLPLPLPTMPTF